MTANKITLDAFRQLSEVHHIHCVSMYFPVNRLGQNNSVDIHQLAIELKNRAQEAEAQLERLQVQELHAKAYLQPVLDLLKDEVFMQKQGNGLALFLSESGLQVFELPLPVVPLTYISSHFYLKPLIPAFYGNGKYFLLALALEDVKLYEGDRSDLREMHVEALLPHKLEEVVGYDYQQKFLNFRSGQSGTGVAGFHGHGEGKDDRKDEVEKFLRAVDKGVVQALSGENAPLVVVSVDYIFSLFKEISRYPQVYPSSLSGSPVSFTHKELHVKTWNLLEGKFNKDIQQQLERFGGFSQTKRAAYDLSEIVPAAVQGRVDTLFVNQEKEVWGRYNATTGAVDIEKQHLNSNDSLLNLAAVHTLTQGGKVYLLPGEQMPQTDAELNAILRY